MKIHRLVTILLLIENHPNIKAKEIAEKLEVSTRTIYRDIDTLCESGFPIYCTTGPTGGIHFSDHYSLGIKYTTQTQTLPLILSNMRYLPSNHKTLSSQINERLFYIKREMNTPTKNTYNRLASKILLDETTWWGEVLNHFDIQILIDSLWQLKSLSITYKTKDGIISSRTVNPYGMVIKSSTWYLIAYCNDKESLRTFKCDRIINSQLTNNAYQIPSSFSLHDYWTQRRDQFTTLKRAEEIYPVTIRLSKNHGTILKDYEVYKLVDEDTHYLATINLHKYNFAIDEICTLLGLCEVITPLNLRVKAHEILLNQLKCYSN